MKRILSLYNLNWLIKFQAFAFAIVIMFKSIKIVKFHKISIIAKKKVIIISITKPIYV